MTIAITIAMVLSLYIYMLLYVVLGSIQVAAIKPPRKMIILVKAGPAVDMILDELIPLLDKDDLVVDGGNEWFELTEAREKKMEEKGLR